MLTYSEILFEAKSVDGQQMETEIEGMNWTETIVYCVKYCRQVTGSLILEEIS